MKENPPYLLVETPPLIGVFEIEGQDMEDLASLLEDLAYRLRERPNAVDREMVGGHYIALVKARSSAPRVEWKPAPNDPEERHA